MRPGFPFPGHTTNWKDDEGRIGGIAPDLEAPLPPAPIWEELARGAAASPKTSALRSPLSLERLALDPDGQVRYQLRKPWIDGRTEIVLDPIAFLSRLAALVPAPYTNLVRYHGVFANRSRDRFMIPHPHALGSPPVAPPDGSATVSEDGGDASGVEAPAATVRPRRLGWAKLLRRVLHVDALTCPECATSMNVIAFLTEPRCSNVSWITWA